MPLSRQGARERILSSLYDAMLDDARWPATSALIDDAVGLTGNGLAVVDGPKDDMRVGFVGLYYRGRRREDLEREYLELYHPTDERIPRLRRRPYGRFVFGYRVWWKRQTFDLYNFGNCGITMTWRAATARRPRLRN